jgi:DNA-binding MarR family transcriptional regulator
VIGWRVAEHQVDEAAVDAVLTASRALVAVASLSLGAAAEDTTIAQYRALVVLASRGPQRMVDLAAALAVTPSTAGRMCDRLVRKGLIRRQRARADRRAVRVSITAAGLQVVNQATARRRELIADILGKLPARQQPAIADALQAFARAAGEIPDSLWPADPADPAGPKPPDSAPARGRA